jgi:polysaccharide biosynthesis/export protein
MSDRPGAASVVVALVLGATAPGCRHAVDFLWVDQVPGSMATAEDPARITPGDVIGVRVFNQPPNSVERTRVRDDGKISMPLLDDVEVAGMVPTGLARALEIKLKAFIVNPVVTVVVHERRPVRVSVVGQVARPGVYDLEPGAGVLSGLAAAGGLTPFADDDGVFVLRSGYWADGDPSPVRIRFRYRELRHGKAPASTFRLRPGDVVVVE